MTNQTITLAMSGASGVPYALRLLECILRADKKVYLLVSRAAKSVFDFETDWKLPEGFAAQADYFREHYQVSSEQLQLFSDQDWTTPIASGSGTADAMVICPCSSGCVAAVAQGSSTNLLQRAADVMLKERKPLIMVHREMPLSSIHLENLLKLSQLGAMIMPANPGFYYKPEKIEDLVDFVVARILDHLHIEHDLLPRWGHQ